MRVQGLVRAGERVVLAKGKLQPDPSSATGVWVGAWTLPPEQQGLVVFGIEAFVQRHLRDRRRNQDPRANPHRRRLAVGLVASALHRRLFP